MPAVFAAMQYPGVIVNERLLVEQADVAYVSRTRIRRERGPMRTAWIPAKGEPITFGVHSEVAEHYGVDPEQYPPDTTTIDYMIAATGG